MMNHTHNNPTRQGARRRKVMLSIFLAFTLLLSGSVAAYTVIHALYPLRYCELVEQSCEEFGVSPTLVYAVIRTESGFDSTARSEVGALGLMQIMPETFGWLQKKLPPDAPMEADALLRPEVNIRYGVFFLSMLNEQFGDDTLTIAAYHAGQNRVRGWLDEAILPQVGCTAQDIPSDATGHYVHKVERAREVYCRLYF